VNLLARTFLSKSQTSTGPSRRAIASHLPSGLIATSRTIASVLATSVGAHMWLGSNKRTVRSRLPETIPLPSGVNVSDVAYAACACEVAELWSRSQFVACHSHWRNGSGQRASEARAV